MGTIDIMGSFQDPLNYDLGAAKLVNVRVVPRDMKEGKVSRVRFVGAPGLTTVSRPSTKACIAMSHALGNIWTGHADGSIYYGVETGSPVLAGFVAVNPANPVIRFAEDRTALCIASNANVLNPLLYGTGYTATQVGGVVNAGLDASINFDPSTVAELNNITIWAAASNVYTNQDSRMYSSNPLAPATVGALNYATKEAKSDRVVDVAISGLVMWPLGSRSLEQWYNPTGSSNFAFTPYPNSLVEVGLAARLSLATLRSNIVFVGTNRRVWLCTGQSGAPVSPPWVDLLLQQLSVAKLSTLTGYAYGQGGSDFYVLTLPGQWSIELSSSTGVWSYRQSPGGRLDHAGRCAVEHDGGIVYVGLDTGHVCYLDMNSSAEPAGTLSRTILTPWVGSEEFRSLYNSIDVTSSMGPAAGVFQFDWSQDGAATWHGVRQITMGNPGSARAVARNMGSGRRRQFRFQYSGAAAPFTMDEIFADTTKGS